MKPFVGKFIRHHASTDYQARTLRAAGALALEAVAAGKWVLIPNGDADSSHLNPSSAEQVLVPKPIELDVGLYEIGRVEPADVVLPVPTVSGRHCMVRVAEDGTTVVTDLGSTNGTVVNGKELRGMQSALLRVGDTVYFGDKHLASFRLEVNPGKTEDGPTGDALPQQQ